jgi:hypothetical protein
MNAMPPAAAVAAVVAGLAAANGGAAAAVAAAAPSPSGEHRWNKDPMCGSKLGTEGPILHVNNAHLYPIGSGDGIQRGQVPVAKLTPCAARMGVSVAVDRLPTC